MWLLCTVYCILYTVYSMVLYTLCELFTLSLSLYIYIYIYTRIHVVRYTIYYSILFGASGCNSSRVCSQSCIFRDCKLSETTITYVFARSHCKLHDRVCVSSSSYACTFHAGATRRQERRPERTWQSFFPCGNLRSQVAVTESP